MNKTTKIALICFDNPFLKPSEGGKKGIMTRIKSLSLLQNCIIDIFFMNKISEGFVNSFPKINNVRNIYQYTMKNSKKCIIGKFPICVNKRFLSECINDLKNQEYDYAIYEGLQVGKYRFKNKVNAKKHILYFHDIESVYRKELAKSTKKLTRKLGNYLESFRFKSMEKKVDSYFDYLWFVSKDECNWFCKRWKINQDKAIYIPIPNLKSVENIASGTNNNTLLYIGDLLLENNIKSLLWFIKNVYNNVKKQNTNAKLKVIGKISNKLKNKLQSNDIEICGYVDDIEQEYDKACCIVNPVTNGAGVKVKTIDSLAHGQILITTLKGIEGTELTENELIYSDNPKILVKKCLEVLNNRQQFLHLAENCINFVKNNHTLENQAKIIDQTINKLNKDL